MAIYNFNRFCINKSVYKDKKSDSDCISYLHQMRILSDKRMFNLDSVRCY